MQEPPAFDEAKSSLLEVVTSVYPHANTGTCITTKASNFAVGAVLELFIEGQGKLISHGTQGVHNNTDHKPLKEGLSCTSAGLVYETTPCPPGDFSSTPTIEDAFSFITRLCCSMQHQHGSHDACLSLNSILLPTFMCSGMIVTDLR